RSTLDPHAWQAFARSTRQAALHPAKFCFHALTHKTAACPKRSLIGRSATLQLKPHVINLVMPNRQGSIRLFHFAGIDVFLHWSCFVVSLSEINGLGIIDSYISSIVL